MKLITTYLFDKINQPREVKWFQNALALFLLYKVVIYFSQIEALFSSNAFIYNHPYNSHSYIDVAFVLTNFFTPQLAFIALSIIGIVSILTLFKISNYVFKILLWLTVINLNNYLYPIITSGDYLLNQLLLFNIFLNPTISKEISFISDLKTVTHNISLLGIKVQICLAYLVAALFKLYDADWLSGQAIHQIIQIPVFSCALLQSIPTGILLISTWFVILYQLLFPVLVWNQKFKIYILSLGIIQHLVIALAMGLFSFGILMMLSYILFLRYDYRSNTTKL